MDDAVWQSKLQRRFYVSVRFDRARQEYAKSCIFCMKFKGN